MLNNKSKVNGETLIWVYGTTGGSLGVPGGLVELTGMIQLVAIRELREATHELVEFRCSSETHVPKALMPELLEVSPQEGRDMCINHGNLTDAILNIGAVSLKGMSPAMMNTRTKGRG